MGKTALAVHWAHRLADKLPDGQLYVDLRGYDPDPPVRPAEALTGFLSALGDPLSSLPAGVAGLTARYRTLLADRRMLVILDNALSVEQVRSLLPGSGRCLTVVTSRDSAAVRRLLDHYLHTARRAEEVLAHNGRPGREPPPSPAPSPVVDAAAAQVWLDSARANLIASAGFATEQQLPDTLAKLSAGTRPPGPRPAVRIPAQRAAEPGPQAPEHVQRAAEPRRWAPEPVSWALEPVSRNVACAPLVTVSPSTWRGTFGLR